jgi:sensor histidine kinase YesM
MPRDTQAFSERLTREFTWPRTGLVIAFCVAYGIMFSPERKTGGAAHALLSYLVGVLTALGHFAPAYVAVAMTAAFAPRGVVARSAVLTTAATLGLGIGYELMGQQEALASWRGLMGAHVASPLPLIIMTLMGLGAYLLHEREAEAQRTAHEEAERQLNLRRQASEARLHVLRSQVEPHFLFNSLAHVRRLYQTDPVAGRSMIRHLSRYLSAALPAMQESEIALGRDLDLAVAYLRVQQIRMGPRLTFEVEVPARLREARIPPLTLTTLVENAIKHGLAPLPEGGTVRIDACEQKGAVKLRVSDTGRGFQASIGAGVGLSNIRARLASSFGTSAQLALTRNAPHGVTATVAVPWNPAALVSA